MRAELRHEVEVAVPAEVLWAYVIDWERQREWIPLTRVEVLDPPADRVGARVRAWTGVGPVGFWDTMTVTAWSAGPDGGSCEVLHTGRLVRGDGEFAVAALGPDRSRFVWWERFELPLGPLGAVGWRLVRPGFLVGLDRALHRLRRGVEERLGPRHG